MARKVAVKHGRPARKTGAFRTRPSLEQLEDRNLLSNGQWMAVFGGVLPGSTIQQQVQQGQNLLHSSGITDQNVQVLDALDLSGTLVVQTPPEVTQQILTTELQPVPGFIFVQDYTPSKAVEGDDNNGINGDFIDGDGYNATYGGSFDYQKYLGEERNGLIKTHAGPVQTPPGTNDVLTNNNLGSTGSTGFTHSETSTIAFGNTVLVSFNDSGENNIASNKFTGWSRSTDGGATFTDGGPLPTNPHGDVGDPVLARNNTTGRIYFATLQISGSGMDIFHSDDGGATWSAPAQGAPGKNGFQDKEWIAVDNFSGPSNGNVYMVNRDFGSGNGIFFYRSTDNGATFGPNGGTAIAISGATQGAFVTVTPDHAIEVFWFNGSVNQMRKSTDGGLTFGAPVTVVSGLIGGVNGDLGLTGIRQGTGSPAGFRSSEFPHAAVNPVNGNLYVTYDNKGAGSDKSDVFFVQSTNGGATWSAPVKVNDDSTNTDQWQPTIAVTPDGTQLGIFYYSRQEDPGNNLFKYYGRVGNISGSTVTFTPSFAVSDTASLPEFGRDGLVNGVYMGDYNTAAATPGAFEVSWSDNRFNLPSGAPRKEPDVFFKKINLGLVASATTPAAGSFVEGTAPTTFVIDFSNPVVPGFAAGVFKVNGVAADAVALSNNNQRATFTFNTSPVTTQGLQTESIAAGAIHRASDNGPLTAFSSTFRFAAVRLRVAGTTPAAGSIIDIPSTGTFTVNLNVPVDPASVSAGSLGLSQGSVSGFTVAGDRLSVTYTLAGLTQEGPLTVTVADGAYHDPFGNPNAAFTGTYTLHYNNFPYPTPLTAVKPLGSLVYDPSKAGTIATATQTDSFTLSLPAGQTLALLVSPTGASLQPVVQLFDSSNNLVASATAPAAGKPALLDATAITAADTYTIVVSGAAGTTGGYNVQTFLDTSLEEALYGGPADTSRDTAQDLEPSYVNISALDASPQRGAVLGKTGLTTANFLATVATPTFEDVSATGTRTLVEADDNFTSVGPSQLNGFTFNFYGRNYNTVFFSSNGLITFGSGNSEYSNTNLTSDPSQATIAPLWQDLVVSGAADSGVDWQVKGAGASQHLVIQWQDVRLYFGSAVFTFEAVLGADGSILFNYKDLTNANQGLEATVGVKDAGTQGPNRLLVSYLGSGPQFIGSNKSTLLTPTLPTSEFYSFNLNAGQSATLALTGLDAGRVVIEELQDGAGTVLALGQTGSTNLGAVINNFVAPADGTYYVRIGGDSFTNYSLVATRDADFATKPNADFLNGQAQAVLSHTTASGQTILGYVAGPETNAYQVQLLGGQTLQVQTQTPLDGAGGPVINRLVPKVNIFDPSGVLVASSVRSAPDGKNVLLSYSAPAGADGYYAVQVTSADGSAGEYVLTLSGQTGVEPDFAVTTATPANHALLRFAPQTITFGFTDGVLVSTVTAGALTVDGQSATAFKVLDGTHVQFTLPTVGQGLHNVNLASTIRDVHGRPVDAYAADFTLDSIGPRVTSSSIQEGDVLSSNNVFYLVTFDKALDTTKINASDFILQGTFRNVSYAADSFTYIADATSLALQYSGLPTDQYTLTLVSGPNNLVDLAGNPLDGAPHWPTPPNKSGTGNPFSTGNFFVHFSIPVGTVAYPTTFTPVKPLGSLVYQGDAVTDVLTSATDTASYQLAVNAGESITVLVTPNTGAFQPTVTLLDASNNVVATASAVGKGKAVVLQTAHAAGDPQTNQVYTIRVSGVSGSVGGYTLQATLDAALQDPNAIAATTQVSLATAFNQVGIQADGSTFGSGIDGFGFALSGDLLGTSQGWNGVPFNIGAVGGNNVVSATSQTITLPAGNFSSLQFLAMAVNGNQPGQTFTVTYTDGTSATFSQGISDWFTPQQYAGEADAVPMAYRNFNDGSKQNATFHVYGYSLALNSAKTVQSVTLPNNAHLKILAETLVLANNYTRASAQDLTPAFADLPKGASAAAVLGETPQAGGYTATAVAPTFEDISATGHPTLQGTDDSVIQLTPANLGGFQFGLYGQTYTSVFYSTNALITFGSGNSEFSNHDLTSDPSQAAIAPLWTDYVAFNASSVVYWEVRGTGSSQRLILEWKNVQRFPGGSNPFLTFEAVLGADGSIQFNYQNVNNAVLGTAGIKDAGTQGPHRLLLAFNNGPNAFVGNNKSTRIAPVPPASEFYSFQLDAGQKVSLALTGLTPGAVAEELQDASGNVLATGFLIGGNVGQAINNFTAPADGTYYVRISGSSLVNYDLVVTQDAVFDNGNNTRGKAPDISGTAGALGYLASSNGTVNEEWYKFTAADGQTLSLATYTPGDGGGLFVNTLAPHFELYAPDGTLAASGTVGADGHNEQITYIVPTGGAGTYFLRITSANGQPGEFFLDPEEAAPAAPVGGGIAILPAAAPGSSFGVAGGIGGGSLAENTAAGNPWGLAGSPQSAVAASAMTVAGTENLVSGGNDGEALASSAGTVFLANTIYLQDAASRFAAIAAAPVSWTEKPVGESRLRDVVGMDPAPQTGAAFLVAPAAARDPVTSSKDLDAVFASCMGPGALFDGVDELIE